MNRDIGHNVNKRIPPLEMKYFPHGIRLSTTIVEVDGWANHILTLTSESKKLD